ncbi:MAG: methyltransferase [Candidatus Latescibacteria bacterium]|nr:methyltransferase [Candidatus Latescibacterota bacterium]
MQEPDKLRQDLVFSEQLQGHQLRFHTTWGLFSPRGVDAGSRLLIDQLEVGPEAVCLDLGCGWGPIGLTLARLAPRGQVHLVDKDFVAVEYARTNAQANQLDNCQIYLSNGFSHVTADRFDLVVSNLPAKVGNEMLGFIMHDAWQRLAPGGHFCVVTIAGLREYIKRNFREIFGNYRKVKQSRGYAVSLAVKEG